MLSAMQAIANTTTSVAEVTPSPIEVSANGSITSTAAAMRSWRACGMAASLEPQDALAEQATRADQQDEQHEEINGRLRELRIAERDHQALHHADDEGSDDDTPERPESADHHHDKGRSYDLVAHRRVDREDRREHHAGQAGKSDAEKRNRRHVWLERDPQRADHVGALDTGAHDASERGPLQQVPEARDAGGRHEQHQDAVIGIDEAADEQLAAELARNRI